MKNKADILEGNISREILDVLLRDHTTQHNIFWATKDYEQWGEGYAESDEITYEKVCDNNKIIPRVLKDRLQQTARSRDMAEVFTPSWVCNAQNNLIDNAWFGREGVFNVEVEENGVHTWIPTAESIVFPEGKTWKDYVRDNRMEITCGEAPYITSRYDATTGELIPVEKRIGLLDRKLRVINENVHTSGEWLAAAQDAYKSIYGFEWQGDNLLLAQTPDGLTEITAGDIIFFEAGETGAHQLYNHTDSTCTYLDLRSSIGYDVIEYPDSDKLIIAPSAETFRKGQNISYLDGEQDIDKIWESLRNP